MNDLKSLCLTLIEELQEYKISTKEELFLKYVNERLNKSFESYQEDLRIGLEYLERRKEINVLRKMNRLK